MDIGRTVRPSPETNDCGRSVRWVWINIVITVAALLVILLLAGPGTDCHAPSKASELIANWDTRSRSLSVLDGRSPPGMSWPGGVPTRHSERATGVATILVAAAAWADPGRTT